MPGIELLPAARSQQVTLENLWQLYVHDFTEFVEDDVDEQGLYPLDFDFARYFDESGRWAYIPRYNGKVAGFVLVSDRVGQRTGPGRFVDEFFVLRRYRGRGVGRSLAVQTFETYRGYWEIVQVPRNAPAQAFWRRVIGEYTAGRFRDFTTPDGDVWQVFDSSAW